MPMVVVLPAPLWPRNPVICPSYMSKLNSRTARLGPPTVSYVLLSPRITTAALASALHGEQKPHRNHPRPPHTQPSMRRAVTLTSNDDVMQLAEQVPSGV